MYVHLMKNNWHRILLSLWSNWKCLFQQSYIIRWIVLESLKRRLDFNNRIGIRWDISKLTWINCALQIMTGMINYQAYGWNWVKSIIINSLKQSDAKWNQLSESVSLEAVGLRHQATFLCQLYLYRALRVITNKCMCALAHTNCIEMDYMKVILSLLQQYLDIKKTWLFIEWIKLCNSVN